ncbi:hypothetical protein HDU67_000805 [Dinochytrium kinnereticum]|nr:hypothetical protein HDU67_000805 [Dinochytrium kinnereticum]
MKVNEHFAKRWAEFWTAQDEWGDIPEAFIERWGTSIAERYSESQRHYHTVSHVLHLLSLLEGHHPPLARGSKAFRILFLAVVFHDVIYDPTRSDNEEMSIALFQAFLNELEEETGTKRNAQLIADEASVIERFISSTIRHVPDDDVPDAWRETNLLFLDWDMEVLSWPKERYDVYAQGIRQEYSHFPNKDYCAGRAKVLRGFLARSAIYFTDIFTASSGGMSKEQLARKNLTLN